MMSIVRLSLSEREALLRPLLDHLALEGQGASGAYRDWLLTPIPGGRNNLLYRARGPGADLAIKFTVRDERDRAGREHGALSALRQAGLTIAPEPVLLDRARYAQPVVVQTWLEGQVCATPPATDAGWQKLVQHLAAVHTITPCSTNIPLRNGTLHASSVDEGRQLVQQQMVHLPEEAQPASLRALLRRLETCPLPEWQAAPLTLCRLDNSTTNYVRRPGPWASVDWEYSGWSDPAFDLANLLTHVAFMDVPRARWDWAVDAYCSLVADPAAAIRTQVYCTILIVWWAARLARYLYEVPRGCDQRLVDWPAGWQVDIQRKYEHYLAVADEWPWDRARSAAVPA